MTDTNTTDDDVLVLNGVVFDKEQRFARDKKVGQRTMARHRARGLPYLDHAGFIWIPRQKGEEFLASKVKCHAQAPRSRARRVHQDQI
jgi:hypothetical protein